MTVISFIAVIIGIVGAVTAEEPLSWGVAILMVALLFRLFWRLALPQNKNK